MTSIDLIAVLLIMLYTALGYWTGAIRRVLGMVILFAACLVATHMGAQGATIYQQYAPSTPVTDARLFSFLAFLFLVLIVLEAMATAIHENLQVSVVALNKFAGVAVGFLTGIVLVCVLVFMLAGYQRPLGGGPLSTLQLTTGDALNHSSVAVPLVKKVGAPVILFVQSALPRDPALFFTTTGGI